MGLIAIGDVHGCLDALNRLIEEINPTPDDHLIFIGDYIDRGPDSSGVIERCLELAESFRCTFLRGNHEDLFLDYLNGDTSGLWDYNGGATTRLSYGGLPPRDWPLRHLDFLRETELYLETEEFVFVHAGIRADKTVAENLETEGAKTFLWERRHLLHDTHPKWEKTVVCGHTPQVFPIVTERLICIDTGAVFGVNSGLGNLTAIRLPSREIVAVPARK